MKKTVKWAPDGESCNSEHDVCKLANYGAFHCRVGWSHIFCRCHFKLSQSVCS